MPNEFRQQLRPHPNLFEINTVQWLSALSVRYQRPIDLGTVPDQEWDLFAQLGMDLVWLMGVWQRSPAGQRLALEEPQLRSAYDTVLPGWSPDDVAGSPYSIQSYRPDRLVGDWQALEQARKQLNRRGIGLILDFVPNHTGLDHGWVSQRPQRYVLAGESECQDHPLAYFPVCQDGHQFCLARGRDPYFQAWQDTLQLDISKEETRHALTDVLVRISRSCDGIRCDMAMLLLNAVFHETWQGHASNGSKVEFWSMAREAVPQTILIAEAYWDTASSLIDLGFDFVYDKVFLDRVLSSPPVAVRESLSGEHQNQMVRFLENHDETRSAAQFSAAAIQPAACLLATVPGMKLYFQGQMQGHRQKVPVQLKRAAAERDDSELSAFYRALLKITADRSFHEGNFRLLSIRPCHDTSAANLIAYCWHLSEQKRLVVVNLSPHTSQGHVNLAPVLEADLDYRFEDLLDGATYERSRSQLKGGLHVLLRPFQTHIFRVNRAGSGVNGQTNRLLR